MNNNDLQSDPRLNQLEENLEEARFSLMIYKLMKEDGKTLIEENNRLKNDPDFTVPPELDKKCLTAINRKFAAAKKKGAARLAYKTFGHIAMFTFLIGALFTAAFAVSDDFRATTINYVINMFDEYSTIEIEGHGGSGDVEAGPVLTWIPDGYELVFTDSNGTLHYEKDDTSFFTYYTYSLTSQISFDTEDADIIEEAKINEDSGTLIIEGNSIILIWINTADSQFCEIRAEGMDREAVIKIAENIQ